MTPKEVTILNYSDLSIAVVGDTKPIKSVLKGLRGSFNPRLKDPKDPEKKLVGWVFAKRNQAKVQDALLHLVSRRELNKVHTHAVTTIN